MSTSSDSTSDNGSSSSSSSSANDAFVCVNEDTSAALGQISALDTASRDTLVLVASVMNHMRGPSQQCASEELVSDLLEAVAGHLTHAIQSSPTLLQLNGDLLKPKTLVGILDAVNEAIKCPSEASLTESKASLTESKASLTESKESESRRPDTKLTNLHGENTDPEMPVSCCSLL